MILSSIKGNAFDVGATKLQREMNNIRWTGPDEKNATLSKTEPLNKGK